MKIGSKLQKDRPENVKLEDGYIMEPVIEGLSMPTGMTFDDNGGILISEAGSKSLEGMNPYWDEEPDNKNKKGKSKSSHGYTPPRVLLITPDKKAITIARGFGAPLLGLEWHKGSIYVTEGGYPGKISRIWPDGGLEVLIDGLPTAGDHKTGHIDFGPDGRMYFGVGSATNSGVVGLDNTDWVRNLPSFHDIPSREIQLAGVNYRTKDPFGSDEAVARTGAYHAFGHSSSRGEYLRGHRVCTGVILRAGRDGSNIEVYAHGLRNPFGIKWINGRLYAVDNGMEARGSRPVKGAPDAFWRITRGGWYGWPDYVGGIPVTASRFNPDDGPSPTFLLAKHPELGKPIACLPPLSMSAKFDVSSNPSFGHVDEVFIAMFGSTGKFKSKTTPGHRIIRMNIETGEYTDFLRVTKIKAGQTGPTHPIQARFDRSGNKMYVLDYGQFDAHGPIPETGGLWVIRRQLVSENPHTFFEV